VAEKKKEKRIRGQDYWTLLGAIKKIDEAKEVWQKWCEKTAKETGNYLDELNFLNGTITRTVVILGPDGEPKDVQAVVADHLPQSVIDEGHEQSKPIMEAVKKAEHVLEVMAIKYQTYKDCIDPKTGVIKDDDYDVVAPPEDKIAGCIPQAPEEEGRPDAERIATEATDHA
jgi:hypothetical protein